jgi:hypothetical protein
MPDEPEPNLPLEQQPPEQAAPEPASPPVDPTDWRLVELGQTRRQLEESRVRENRALSEVERMRAEHARMVEMTAAATRPEQGSTPPQQPPPANAADFDRAVNDRAAQMAAQDRVKQLDVALQRDFAEDYRRIVENFGNITNSVNMLFGDMMATGEGPYVAATIGKDPTKIQQLRDMPDAERRMALMRIALEKPKATAEPAKSAIPKPSEAPPPPTPAPRGGLTTAPIGAVDLYDPRFEYESYRGANDPVKEAEMDAAWYGERGRQKRESQGRHWSPRTGPGGR